MNLSNSYLNTVPHKVDLILDTNLGALKLNKNLFIYLKIFKIIFLIFTKKLVKHIRDISGTLNS